MRNSGWGLILIVFLLVFPQGCATPDKPLTIKNMQSVPAIQVARNESPCLLKKTAGSQAVAFTGVMFGAIGGGLGAAISHGIEQASGKSLTAACALPDFGKLVLDGFADRMQNDFPDWPKPSSMEDPIPEGYKPSGSTHFIVLQVCHLQVDDTAGLRTATVGKMINPAGQVVWEKGYVYKSADFSRPHSLKELEAQNGKLLKEEFLFAADKTISDFTAHLKGVPSTATPPPKEPAPSPEVLHPDTP
ncbi:MAG: hypothetical protein WAW37_18095 [Syntrophobacteraceae bacterium]